MAVRTAAPLPLLRSCRNKRICGNVRGQPLEDVAGAVGRAVVDDDQLALHVLRQRRREHQRNAALDHGALVVDRHQDRQLHRTNSSLAIWFQRAMPRGHTLANAVCFQSIVRFCGG